MSGSNAVDPVALPAGSGPAAWDRRDTLTVGGLALACLFLFAWGLGSYPLWDPWESMYAESTVEMAERGDWLSPWLDGKPDPSQPIFFYWAMGLTMAIVGSGEIAARLPSALSAVGGVLVLFYCVRRLRGFNTALPAAAVLATLPQYYYLARQAMPDMVFTVCLTGTMGFFALARFCESGRRIHLALFYASLALAVMVQGPLALVIGGGALLVFGLFELDRRTLQPRKGGWTRLRDLAARYRLGMGTLIFFVITAPWHVALLFKDRSAFVDSFLLGESLRYFTDSVGGNDGTSEFYARDLFHGMYPWISLLPLWLLGLLHGATRFDDDARQKWYFVAWCTTVFVVFTLAGTKQDHYLLPIAPALAVLVALGFEAWFRERAPFWVVSGLWISLLFALMPIRDFLIEGDRYIFRVFSGSENLDYPGLETALKIFLGAWIVAITTAALRRRSWIVLALAIAVAYGHAVYMTQAILPDHTAVRTLRGYTDLVERLREPDAELLFFGDVRYSVHYYFGRERFRRYAAGSADALASGIAGKPHVYIIAESDEMQELSSALRRYGAGRWFPIAGDHPDYILLTNSSRAIGAR